MLSVKMKHSGNWVKLASSLKCFYVSYFAIQCIDDGGFLKFVILEDVIDDVPGPVNKILRLFHTKVGTIIGSFMKTFSP